MRSVGGNQFADIYSFLPSVLVSSLRPITRLGDSLTRFACSPDGQSLTIRTPIGLSPTRVVEIRVRVNNEFRFFYFARFRRGGLCAAQFRQEDSICMQDGIDLGKARYAAMLEARKGRTSTDETAITKGSGDVFANLGFSRAEARNPRIRAEMTTALRSFIHKEGLTQADAASC